jgi:hypothetical protein
MVKQQICLLALLCAISLAQAATLPDSVRLTVNAPKRSELKRTGWESPVQFTGCPLWLMIEIRGRGNVDHPRPTVLASGEDWPAALTLELLDCTPHSADSGQVWNARGVLDLEMDQMSSNSPPDTSYGKRGYNFFDMLGGRFGFAERFAGHDVRLRATVAYGDAIHGTLTAFSPLYRVRVPKTQLDSAAWWNQQVQELSRRVQSRRDFWPVADSLYAMGCWSANGLWQLYEHARQEKDLERETRIVNAMLAVNASRRQSGQWASGEYDMEGIITRERKIVYRKRLIEGLDDPPAGSDSTDARVAVIERIRNIGLERWPMEEKDSIEWQTRCDSARARVRRSRDFPTLEDQVEACQSMLMPPPAAQGNPHGSIDVCRSYDGRWPYVRLVGANWTDADVAAFDDCLDTLRNADGLILDLRELLQQDPAPLLRMLGRFVSKPSGKLTLRRRVPGTAQYRDSVLVVRPRRDRKPFLKPLAICKGRSWPQSAVYQWLAGRPYTQFETQTAGTTDKVLPDTLDVGLGLRVMVATARVLDRRDSLLVRKGIVLGSDEDWCPAGDCQILSAYEDLPELGRLYRAHKGGYTLKTDEEFERDHYYARLNHP